LIDEKDRATIRDLHQKPGLSCVARIEEGLPRRAETATAHKQIRIIDESGEHYLYPADYFVSIRFHRR
jgi:hypothetical protein